MEEWRPVVRYEGLYEVSNKGMVRSVDRKGTDGRNLKGKLLSNNHCKDSYLTVVLYKNDIKNTRRIHRLVSEAFIENPLNKPFVNHIDGDKRNNNVENLEWVTEKENAQHALRTGLMKRANLITSEKNSKPITAECLATGEILKFKNREKFSLSLGYNKHWFSKALKSNKDLHSNLEKLGYKLINY